MSEDQSLRLAAMVLDAGSIVQALLEKQLVRMELGLAQYRVLAALLISEDRLTPSDLAALLLQETHSISGLLNRLEERGLVTRSRGGKPDRRVVRVQLTAEGKALAERAGPIVKDTVQLLLAEASKGPIDRHAQFLDDFISRATRLSGVDLPKRKRALEDVRAENSFLA